MPDPVLFLAHLVHDSVPAHVEDQLRVRPHLHDHRARGHLRAVRRDLRALLLQGARALPEDARRRRRGQGHHDRLRTCAAAAAAKDRRNFNQHQLLYTNFTREHFTLSLGANQCFIKS